MAVEDAIQNLGLETNAHIEWAFGDILRLWAQRGNWRSSLLLQQLEANHPNLAIWSDLIHRTRVALADEAELRSKAHALLSPSSIRFNDVMDDFLAEMLAAQYLHALGHTEIHFVRDDEEIHTDLRSRSGEIFCVTEAKNLREPVALTKVAFLRWNHNRSVDRERYNFTADMVDLDDPLSDLTPEQERAVVALVDDLPNWKRPNHRIHSLPGGRRILARVSNGMSVMITQGGGPFRVDGDNGIVAKGRRGLILKLLEHTRKALGQLYADAVPDEYRKLLFVRWKPPEQFVVAPEAVDQLREEIQASLRTFLAPAFPRLQVAITHVNERPDQAVRVEWN
ncbi:MAG: hypothetical protein ABSE51_19255 [Terracidiphilus sp.]|jgi:hypothetical protein